MCLRRLQLYGFIAVFFTSFSLSFSQQTLNENHVIAKSETAVPSVAWSPDGRVFASAWNNSVVLWNAESGKIAAIYQEHSRAVKVVRFSCDGSRLLSLGQDNMVVMRDLSESLGSTRVLGSDYGPMNDALFAGDNTSVILPRNGLETTHYYPLRMTNQFISKQILRTGSPVKSYDYSDKAALLLVATEDGKISLVNLQKNSLVEVYSGFASGVAPRFSPDGRFVLFSVDEQTLVLRSVGGKDSFNIKDSDWPVNSAVFSADGTLIAAALKNGGVKVYNVKNGTVQNSFMLPSLPDVVCSLAFSPDAKRLVAGTGGGSVLCWTLSESDSDLPVFQNPEDFSKTKSKAEDSKPGAKDVSDLNEAEPLADSEPEEEVESEDKTKDSVLEVLFTLTTLNEDYYHNSFGISGAWKSYKRLPFYYGFGAEISTAPPDDDYPYSNSYNGKKLNNPWLYRVHAFGCAGYGYRMEDKNLLFFAEGRLGFGGNFLFNNEITYRHSSHLAGCVLADLLAGVQWKALSVSGGLEYDSTLGFLIKGNAGAVIHLGK